MKRQEAYSRRRVARGAATAGLALSLWAGACKDKDPPVEPPPLPVNQDAIERIDALAQSPDFYAPFDGAPTPDGSSVYFTAHTADGPAVFSISAAGGSAARLAAGEPLAAPFGVISASDGQSAYVADSAAEPVEGMGLGRIFRVSAQGGALAEVAGSEGTMPRSLDLVPEGGVDMLYFTGVDPSDGAPAVWKLPAAGGPRTLVLKGSPLVEPSGIVVAADANIYVADAGAESPVGGAALVKINGRSGTVLAGGMRFGHPAGIALVPSETRALISGLDVDAGHSAVFAVELATGKVEVFDDQGALKANYDSAGLHRARNANVYAWANAAGDTKGESFRAGGTVYLLRGPTAP